MTRARARMPALVALGALALAALAILAIRASSDGFTLRAEFTDARGLREGNEVRVQGAPAGSVEKIELTDRGTALVTLRLHDGLPPPRRDAVAAIRPVDLLGDIFLSLSLGSSEEPLEGALPVAQTVNAPRLDELLKTFKQPVRTGLQALFVELGLALERRGVDLNRAIAELSPALEATDELMGELGSQTASLRELVEHAHRATSQLARRDGDLRALVNDFAAIVTTTADRTNAIGRDLEAAPPTLAQLERTANRLERTASAATPLAEGLRDAAPGLAAATATMPRFLDRAEVAVGDVRPLVRRLTSLLELSDPALRDLAVGGRRLSSAGPELRRLMPAVVDAAPAISEGFFVNFADQAEESGTQDFDPQGDPARKYWRGAGVFTCEAFGVKVEPGCLDRYLGEGSARAQRRGGRPVRDPRDERLIDFLLGP